jgi:oxygen-dependent protoporphyrinogen oxidase
MQTYDCIIVGAGISGLSAAYELHRRGASLLVVESQAEPGGSMRSERTAEGFVLENGPNTVVSSSPALEQHFADLGIADERIVADRRGARRYILLDGQLELIPTSPPAFLRSSLLSNTAKLRLLAEPLLPRANTPDESVETFFTRRLGSEPARRLVDPFVSGVYAGNPKELSVKSTFPAIWEAEQEAGSVILGMIRRASRQKKQRSGPRKRSEMMSFRNGLATWPQAIVQALGSERVWFNSPASALQTDGQTWQLMVTRDGQEQTLTARRVVLAVPAHVAAKLVAGLDEVAAQALRGIPYPPMAVVHLGYRRADVAHPLDGFGMLCPSREGRKILGTLWPSSLFEGRAPDDMVLTTSFVGGARMPEQANQDQEELIESVAAEQQAIVGARAEPVFAHVAHWSSAISQYLAGHTGRMDKLERLEAMFHGLHLIGNYRDGVSVEKCWHKGHDLGLNLPLPQ